MALWDLKEDALARAKAEADATDTQALDVSDPPRSSAPCRRASPPSAASWTYWWPAQASPAQHARTRLPVEAWRQVIDVNLNGLFYCNQAALQHLERNGYGRIVNIASVAGKEGNPNASAYSTSKAGVIGFTKSLAKEMAKTEIRVNCVTPAAVRTAIFDQMSQQHIDFMLSKIPIGRFGAIEEVTSLVCWLASEECSFSTGAVFDVSGGRATY